MSVAACCCGLLCIILVCGGQAVPSKAVVVQTSDVGDGDSLALIQQKMVPRHGKSTAGRSSLSQVPSALPEQAAPFTPYIDPKDCASYPELCSPPFECQKYSNTTLIDMTKTGGWATDGKPNYRVACYDKRYATFNGKCASGDLRGAALERWQGTLSGKFEEETNVAPCGCFMSGMCMDTEVTNSTTIADMGRLCDERFGHKNWTTYGAENSPPENLIGYDMEKMDMTDDDSKVKTASMSFLFPYQLLSCVTGTYHCSVLFCKEYVCKDESFKRKCGDFLLQKFGWVA